MEGALPAVESSDSTITTGSNSANPLGLTVLWPGTGTVVADVIFVHGLREHAINTWSNNSGSVCWPRDLLKNDLANVRVISWGYDSSIAKAFTFTSNESIFGHADNLLEDIAALRANEKVFTEFRATTIYTMIFGEGFFAGYRSY